MIPELQSHELCDSATEQLSRHLPLFSHHNTHQAQLPSSLPNFPFHLVQFQAQLLTWDHSRPLWGCWWRLWLACQGVCLPLQQQPVTNSLVHEAQHTHSSTRSTPRAEWPGPTPDHSHEQLIARVFAMHTMQLTRYSPFLWVPFEKKKNRGIKLSSDLTLSISCC